MRHAVATPQDRGASRRLPYNPALLLLAMLGAILASAVPAQAAFPGPNGPIAYQELSGVSIKTTLPDGSQPRVLQPGEDAAWSADGRKLAFNRQGDIYTMNADGTGVRQLTSGDMHDSEPAWSPGGDEIVFRRADPAGPRDLHIMAADGSAVRRVPVTFTWPSHPDWSPDGSLIAFSHTAGIAVVRPDGSGQSAVVAQTTGPQEVNNYTLLRPDWSPDGARLTFQRGTDVVSGGGHVADSEVAVINADGSGMQVLTDNLVSNHAPVWSPDGSKILYGSLGGTWGGDGRFHTINPDGSGDVALSFGGRYADWAPDGDRDADGVRDSADNCPDAGNADQADQDGDGSGDACDADRDGDGSANATDNCADAANADQADADADGLGDVCDADRDGDGIANAGDNCPDSANAGQADADADGLGDACDADRDGDGVADESDNCADAANADQADADADGLGDVCDADRDGDGIANGGDNCADAANADQGDWDADGQGDACDADRPAGEQIVDITTTIDGLPDLPPGMHNSLTQKLEQALAAYNAGDVARACTKVESFEREVSAQAGKKISRADADVLLAAAAKLEQTMGC